jgi:hypothetical protein
MKKSNHILTKYLSSGNGGNWWVDENRMGFLSPITINRMTIKAKIGDVVTIEEDASYNVQRVHINGVLAFQEKE